MEAWSMRWSMSVVWCSLVAQFDVHLNALPWPMACPVHLVLASNRWLKLAPSGGHWDVASVATKGAAKKLREPNVCIFKNGSCTGVLIKKKGMMNHDEHGEMLWGSPFKLIQNYQLMISSYWATATKGLTSSAAKGCCHKPIANDEGCCCKPCHFTEVVNNAWREAS